VRDLRRGGRRAEDRPGSQADVARATAPAATRVGVGIFTQPLGILYMSIDERFYLPIGAQA
jgi:hypothetical protein